ncbi:hypothetical protein [Actinoplanes sp. HUAS TT8]|uniref:hypothetical protein n=1 Tax=Actinoplanes sp. HUAS TT8 TaxID=3447453 RepID=UPI003F51EEB5
MNQEPGDGWRSVRTERRVLVVVRTTTTLTRLLDVVSLIAPDRRVQVVFTADDANSARLATGTRSILDGLEAVVIPWAQATRETYDLALAASENDALDQLDAPVILLPHGVGHLKFYPGTSTVSGATPARLRKIAGTPRSVVAVSHSDQVRRLAAAHPPVAATARVVGDPALGRMLASRHRPYAYRRAFDSAGRTLVVVASTWGPDALLGFWPELPERLLAELPVDEYRVVAVLHPGIWAHGPWQVRAWWSRAAEYGLRIVPPESGWQAALLGASVVLTDFGSLGVYAAALDKPLLLSPHASPTTVPGSPAEALARHAPALDQSAGLRGQVDAAIRSHLPRQYAPLTASAIDDPGSTAARLRSLLYEMMALDEPPHAAEFTPVPVPARQPTPPVAMVVSAEVSETLVSMVRYPAVTGHAGHLVADLDRARLDQVAAATILRVGAADPGEAADLLRQWPRAEMITAQSGPDTCWVFTREAEFVVRARVDDVTVLASWAYLRGARDGRLRLGDRIIEVRVEAA